MTRHSEFTPIHTVLIPLVHEGPGLHALNLARLFDAEITLVGVVVVPPDRSLSTGAAAARVLRRLLRKFGKDKCITSKSQVIVSYEPWQELSKMLQADKPDLLFLEFESHLRALHVTLSTVLIRPPCNVALVRGRITGKPNQVLVESMGARSGKGEALWKSLFVTRGDIIVWIDTDIVNIHPRFVYGILGPLLQNPQIQLVKGFYRRPLKVGSKIQAGGGGRVTELTARPLLNLFYLELSGVIQPLSGEYAGRRQALEAATFCSGYGVETGLLIDIYEQYGLSAIAQVDLLERIHHNQHLEALSKMSFAIIQTVMRKLEKRFGRAVLEDVNRSMKLIRHDSKGYFLDVEEIAELERPSMLEVDEYRSSFKREVVAEVQRVPEP